MCIEGVSFIIGQQFTFYHNGQLQGYLFFTHNTPTFTVSGFRDIDCDSAYNYSYFGTAQAEGNTFLFGANTVRHIQLKLPNNRTVILSIIATISVGINIFVIRYK